MDGVSFVVPVHNGAACVREALESIVAQADGRPMEIIVVDDLSQDDSSAVLRRLAELWPLRIVPGHGRGAAAAINTGVRAARFPIICQVDQDVVLKPGWMRRLLDELDDPAVGAVQGCYVERSGLDAVRTGDGARPRTAVCRDPGARDHARLHGQRRVSCRSASHGRPPGRDLRLRLRQRSQLPVTCRRLPVDLLPRGAERAPVARGIDRVSGPAIRVRLRPHRSRGQASRAVSPAIPCRRRA